jgi:glyoxylate reductase
VKVLVTDHVFNDLERERSILEPLGCELVLAPGTSERELVEAVRDAEAILVCYARVTTAVIAAAAEAGCRVISRYGVGYDNIDVEAATRAGVVVCNTPGILDETTADLAFALMLAAARRAFEAEADLRAGRWAGWGINQYLGQDIHGATLGLVGYGGIGRAVARRAAGFSMEVLHHTRRPTGEPGWVAELPELLRRSDVVSLHVPLTEATRHLIGPEELSAMKPTAVLVNTSRGPVVDEAALAEALYEGRIFAAGLDVYEAEPVVHPRLLSAPRTVLLPHVGTATVATRTAMARLAAESAREVLLGRMPPTAVNPEAASRWP